MKKDVISLIVKKHPRIGEKIPCEHILNGLLSLKGNKDDIPSLDELPQKVHFFSDFCEKKLDIALEMRYTTRVA